MLSQLRTAVIPPPLRPPYPPPPGPSLSSRPIALHPHTQHGTPVAPKALPPGPPPPGRAILPKTQPPPHPLHPPPPPPLSASPAANGLYPDGSHPPLSYPPAPLWASVNQDAFLEDAMAGGSSSASTWSDAEKIALLVEILKDCQAAPNWRNIPIPPGRNVIEAQHVFTYLTSSPPSSPKTAPLLTTSVQTPSAPPAPSSAPRKRSAPSTPVIAGQEPVKKKRGRPSKADLLAREQERAAQAAAAAGVALPAAQFTPHMYTPDASKGGVALATPATPASASSTTPASTSRPAETTVTASLATAPVKRKRGRPSKADLEERRRREEEAASQAAANQLNQSSAQTGTDSGGADADEEAEAEPEAPVKAQQSTDTIAPEPETNESPEGGESDDGSAETAAEE